MSISEDVNWQKQLFNDLLDDFAKTKKESKCTCQADGACAYCWETLFSNNKDVIVC